jgi:hypothetical protein
MGQCFSPQEKKKEVNKDSNKAAKTKEEKNVEKVVSANFSSLNQLIRTVVGLTKARQLGKRPSTTNKPLATFTSKASYLDLVNALLTIGAFGEVRECVHNQTGETRAVKIMKTDKMGDKEYVRL